VMRADLAVMVEKENTVLEVDLRGQDLADLFRPGQLAALRDEPVRQIDRQDAGGADPLLRPGDQKAVGGAAGGPSGMHDRKSTEEHDAPQDNCSLRLHACLSSPAAREAMPPPRGGSSSVGMPILACGRSTD